MHSKKGKHANNLTRIDDQVKLLIVMLWISYWTHKANIGESERRPKTKSCCFVGIPCVWVLWILHEPSKLEYESESAGEGEQRSFIWVENEEPFSSVCDSKMGLAMCFFSFSPFFIPPFLLLWQAWFLLIFRERERVWNSKGKVNCGFLMQLLKYPHSLLKGKMPLSNSFLLLGGGKYQDHYRIMFSSWSLWLWASEIC